MQLFSRYRSIAQVQKLLVFSVSLAVALSLYVYFTDGVIYYFISAKGTDEAYIIPSNDHITANSTFTTNSSQFLLTPATSSSKLLISVKSSPQSFAQRKAIRDSWGAQAKYLVIPVIFVLGKAKSSLVDDAIKAEHNHHKDILQGNFDDSYDNLPLKTLLFAEWFILSNQFQVTFYTDDDSLVFVLNLMALLTKLDLSLKLPFILGHCWPSGAPVLRRGKNAVPETVIRDDVYPPFCSGVGYLISKSALKLLLQKPIEKSWLKALKNEDVIFTGYLREKSAIPFVHTDNVIRFKVFNVANCDKFLISAHQYNSPDEMIRFWSKFQSQMQDC